MATFETYSNRYKHVQLERSDEGILQITLHKDGGEAKWSGDPGHIHEQLGDCFYQVGRDPDNRVIILTGTGDNFCVEMDKSVGGPLNSDAWSRIFKEGRDLLQNLLDIDAPIIGAVNGPAFIHAELATMSDIVIASERASFADKAHAPSGVAPADGVHVWWEMLLGPNRSRHFLLTGAEISAQEAKQIGFVAEVVPHEKTLERAWEVARALAAKPTLMLRFSRIALTQNIKRRVLEDLGYGLMLEGMGIFSLMGK